LHATSNQWYIYIYITSPGFIFLKAFDAFVITTDLKLWIQDYIYIYMCTQNINWIDIQVIIWKHFNSSLFFYPFYFI
jgi:hypothetical protein